VQKLQENDPKHKVNMVISKDLQSVADEALIKVVLQNLLANAWKYSRKNKNPTIMVGMDKDQPTNCFFIKDNGVGFDMKNIDQLFKPFSRLHSDEEFEGNGIGLATAHRIILKHGGEIWAESKINKGATFFFTLGSES